MANYSVLLERSGAPSLPPSMRWHFLYLSPITLYSKNLSAHVSIFLTGLPAPEGREHVSLSVMQLNHSGHHQVPWLLRKGCYMEPTHLSTYGCL